MLALPDQRRAGQDDGQQRDVVDDLHHRAEPGLVERGVEAGAQCQIHGWRVGAAVTLDELIDFAGEDLLDIATAGEGLAHAGGVDIELHGRRSPRQHVALEVGRNDQSEGVQPRVHARVHVPIVDHGRWRELRGVEGRGNPLGQRRIILVDDGDGRVVQRLRHGRGLGVDRRGEHIDDEHKHHRIAPKTPQLLDTKVVDVGQVSSAHLNAPAS